NSVTFLPLYCWLHWILPSTNELAAAPPAAVVAAPAAVVAAPAAVVAAPAAVVAAPAAGVLAAVVDSLLLSLPHAVISTPAATSAVNAARCLLLMDSLPLRSVSGPLPDSGTAMKSLEDFHSPSITAG